MGNINVITREDIAHFSATIENQNVRNLLDQYQRIATKSARYPGTGSPLGLMYCTLKVNGEAGELAEHVGKALRDDGYADGLIYVGGEVQEDGEGLTKERRVAIIKEIGDKLWYLAALCNELGINLSQCAIANLEKLCDRGERGKLQGSGDNR